MKLKGLTLVVPVCDLRWIVEPDARVPYVNPLRARVGEKNRTHLTGFGAARTRTLHIPWRPVETISYACHGAVSLPNTLPEGGKVAKTVRRLYSDGRVTLRFDLSLFAWWLHDKPVSRGSPRGWVSESWSKGLVVRDDEGKHALASSTALDRLVAKYAGISTAPGGEAHTDLVRRAPAKYVLIVETSTIPEEATPISADPLLGCTQGAFQLPGEAGLTSLTAIWQTSDVRRTPRGYETIRMARAVASWINTDLEVLDLLTLFEPPETGNEAWENATLELARGLARALDGQSTPDLSPAPLLALPQKLELINARLSRVSHLSAHKRGDLVEALGSAIKAISPANP